MYLEIDEGFATHRKTLRFCALMMDHNAFAYILRLWTWACRSAPDGDLAGMEAMDIEIAVQYRHNDGKCYAAMVKAGFIDETANPGEPARLHNWMKRTGQSIKKMVDDAAWKKTWRAAHKDKKCPGKDVCETCRGLSLDNPKTGAQQSDTEQTRTDQNRPVLREDSPPAIPVPPVVARGNAGRQPFTGVDLGNLFGTVRSRIIGGLEWQGTRCNPQIAATRAAEVNANRAEAEVERTMEVWWERVKAGEVEDPRKCLEDDSFAFGCWWAKFRSLRDQVLGVAPVAPAARAGPARKTSGRGTAEEQEAKAREMFEAGRRWAEGASDAVK